MGFFKQLGKIVARTATLPVSVAKDVVTLGGVLIEEDEPATFRHLRDLVEDIDELPESMDEED